MVVTPWCVTYWALDTKSNGNLESSMSSTDSRQSSGVDSYSLHLEEYTGGMEDSVLYPGKKWYHAFTISWAGQMVASLSWIVSVFLYGLEETGDYFQLLAASAWLIANVADFYSNCKQGHGASE